MDFAAGNFNLYGTERLDNSTPSGQIPLSSADRVHGWSYPFYASETWGLPAVPSHSTAPSAPVAIDGQSHDLAGGFSLLHLRGDVQFGTIAFESAYRHGPANHWTSPSSRISPPGRVVPPGYSHYLRINHS